MTNKKTLAFPALILLIIFLTPPILAFGVAVPYWDSPEWYPLKLAPGESKIVTLTLQNTGEEDITFKANITSGSEIAELIDESLNYFVPSGEIDKQVNIRVTIPENSQPQSQYKISVSFLPISAAEGGMVSFSTGLTASFPVETVGYEESIKRTEEISETPAPKEQGSIWLWIVILAILIAIASIIIIKKSQASKKFKSLETSKK